jgi:hypothetical protein
MMHHSHQHLPNERMENMEIATTTQIHEKKLKNSKDN